MRVDYKCDECEKGYMKPTGDIVCCCPPKFPHSCTECGAKLMFRERYPTIRYCPEGELLDLDKYIQPTY